MSLSSVTGYADYKLLCQMGAFQASFIKGTSGTGTGNAFAATWQGGISSGAAPADTTTVNSTITGGIFQSSVTHASTNPVYIGEIEAQMTANITPFFMLIDRLTHSAGCVWNVATAQTTNLPTPLPDRSSGGASNMMALMNWTSAANAAATVTVVYTDEGGTSGNTAPVVNVAASVPSGRAIIIPTVSGDKGVRVVEQVTIGTSGTTAGNFGFMVFRPLAILPLSGGMHGTMSAYRNMLVGGAGAMSSVQSSACLDFLTGPLGTGENQALGRVNLLEIP